MAKTESLPELGGQLSEDCPKFVRKPCYQQCAHVNQIMSEHYNFENYLGSPRHKSLTESILNLQDQIIKDICEFNIDICVKGAWLGFSCIQCKNVCDSGTEPFDCGYEKITFYDCVTKQIDFSSTSGLLEIYTNIVNALSKVYEVTVKGVQDYADAVFNVTSEVVRYQSEIMYLNLTRTLSEDEETAWGFIKETFPLPIQTQIILVN